LKKGNIAMDF